MKILSLNYLGNVQYFSKLCQGDCVIDTHENFLKQSYRTRCEIMTTNGTDTLSIHTIKGSNFNKNSIAQTRIDYSKRWQHQHWQAIFSAYKNSPYFDYYYEEFEPFYRRRYDFLVDFNGELLDTTLRLLGSPVKPLFAETYITPKPTDEDWRNAISPKSRLCRPDTAFAPAHYWQVFSDRQPFAPNLSIIDLLFCEGPSALSVIKASTHDQ